MKHPSVRELFEYWNERRGHRPAPERADIEPGAIRRLLADTFILSFEPRTGHPFRIAGTRVCALFGRELKGESFVELWQRSGQAEIRELLAVAVDEKIGVVASATGATSDDRLLAVQLELLLLPLAFRSRREARMLGALVPMAAPYWLGAKAVGPLTLGTFRHLGAAIETTAPRFAAAAGRLKRGLTIYEGGRID